MTQKEQEQAGNPADPGNHSEADGKRRPADSSRLRQAAGTENEKEPRSRETVREIGGPRGPEPTRYGDWERNGRCIDF